MKRTFRPGSFLRDPAEDVREELESHLEFETEALMEEGLDEGEARAAAEKKLGPRRKIESEAIRYASRLNRRRQFGQQADTLRQDIGFAFRTLRRTPVATLITIVLLAMGVGANTALFSMLRGVVLEPLGLPGEDELVFLQERDTEGQAFPVSYANYRDWKEDSRTVAEMGAYLARHVNLTGGGESRRVRGALVTSSLFSVFGVSPQLGRPLLAEEDVSGLPVVVLDHGVWQTRYGADPEIIGKDIGLDGVPHQVVGVMPPGFQQPDPTSSGPIQVWVPLPAGTEFEPRRSHSYQVLGRLASGVPLQAGRDELGLVAGRLAEEYPESNQGAGIQIDPVHKVLFGEARGQILLVLVAAVLVLLIACGNIASLQLARAAMRRGEMAVRGALGGSRWRIIRQLLTENGILAIVGGAGGVLVAWWTLGLLRAFAPPEFPRIQSIQLDGPALLFSLAISMMVGSLFGLAPGLRSVRVPLSAVLKEEHGRDGRASKGAPVQSVFIVGQLAMSLVLGNAAILLGQSYGALRGNELGFRTRDVLTMELSLRGEGYSVVRGRAEFYDELLPGLRGLPGVEEVGAGTSLPLAAGATANVVREEDWANGPEAVARVVETERVAGSFFSALGVPFLSGRPFVRGEDDAPLQDTRAILNQAAASSLWPGEDPLGRRFSYAGDEPHWITVVGVVADTRNGSLGLDPLPEIYLPYASFPSGRMFLAIRTAAEPQGLVQAVVEEIHRVDPRQAVSQVRTMEEVVGARLSRREFYTTLVTAFAALAFLLAGAGIYGVVSQYVAARRKEIGIRLALGSGERALLGLVIGRVVRLAGLGMGLGAMGAYLSKGLIQGYLYGIGPLDLFTLMAGVLVLFGVAILGAIAPAWKGCKVDPVGTLGRG